MIKKLRKLSVSLLLAGVGVFAITFFAALNFRFDDTILIALLLLSALFALLGLILAISNFYFKIRSKDTATVDLILFVIALFVCWISWEIYMGMTSTFSFEI